MAMPTIKDVKEWDTDELIDFLRGQNLKLDEKNFEVFHAQEITGLAFLKLTKEELEECGLKIGPAIVITELIKKLTDEVQTERKKKLKIPKFLKPITSLKRKENSNKHQLTVALKEQTVASTEATQKLAELEKSLMQINSDIASTLKAQKIHNEENQTGGSDTNYEMNKSFGKEVSPLYCIRKFDVKSLAYFLDKSLENLKRTLLIPKKEQLLYWKNIKR